MFGRWRSGVGIGGVCGKWRDNVGWYEGMMWEAGREDVWQR